VLHNRGVKFILLPLTKLKGQAAKVGRTFAAATSGPLGFVYRLLFFYDLPLKLIAGYGQL
jgi:hypothetical protein